VIGEERRGCWNAMTAIIEITFRLNGSGARAVCQKVPVAL